MVIYQKNYYTVCMKPVTRKDIERLRPYIPVSAFAILLGGGIYLYSQIYFLSNHVDSLSRDLSLVSASLASTTAKLNEDIKLTNTTLSAALNQQTLNVGVIEKRLEQQVGNVAGTLTNLQRLSKIDPQLLVKYSKVFFLSENYAPSRVTEIPSEYKYSDKKAVSIHTDVWPRLKTLIDDAKGSGIQLYVSSGYRPFDEQKALKSDYSVTYGAGTANQFSADQGYSEHQLGTTVDFLTPGIGGDLERFEGTSAYQWLLANAHRYGFILSYPKNNQFYVFEPWHWRYVGVKLAIDLKNQGKNFYGLDQRKIDEYLINVFE